MNKKEEDIELLKKHLLSPIVINEETQNAILMAIEALEHKPPVISDEEIENKIDELLIEGGHHPSKVRHPIYGEERQIGIGVAKWMCKLLINQLK